MIENWSNECTQCTVQTHKMHWSKSGKRFSHFWNPQWTQQTDGNECDRFVTIQFLLLLVTDAMNVCLCAWCTFTIVTTFCPSISITIELSSMLSDAEHLIPGDGNNGLKIVWRLSMILIKFETWFTGKKERNNLNMQQSEWTLWFCIHRKSSKKICDFCFVSDFEWHKNEANFSISNRKKQKRKFFSCVSPRTKRRIKCKKNRKKDVSNLMVLFLKFVDQNHQRHFPWVF